MFKNYLTTALRHFWKQKSYAILNVAGLAVGLTTSLLILLWVQDERSYDAMHEQVEKIYRVNANFETNGALQSWGDVPAPVASVGAQEIPEIEEAVRIVNNHDVYLFRFEEKIFTETKCAYIDPSFFSIFSFQLLKGNPAQPFSSLHSVIITATTAKRYFGDDDPIGKMIQADGKQEYVVSGVIEDFPGNSSIQYDMLFPMEILVKNYQANDYWKSLDTDWGNFYCITFLQLHEGSVVRQVAQKLTQLQRNNNPYDPGSYYTLQPLSQIHLYGADGSAQGIQEVRIFAIVAFIILLIACINYVNLATARATKRAKEVSIRKLIGAGRPQLFAQILGESALLFIIAMIVSLIVADLLMPVYNELTEKKLTFSLLDPSVGVILGAAFLFTVFMAGIYPALLLSSFEPLVALKGKQLLGSASGTFRKVLVVTQFTLSISLIIGTLVIGRQMEFIRNKKLGYDRENVFTFGMREMNKHLERVRNELLKQPGVLAVTTANQNLVNVQSTTGDTHWNEKDPNSMFMIHPIGVDKDFLKTLNIPLVEGRGFTGSPADSAHFILNETAVKESGIKDPIGKTFTLWQMKGTIIGVAKDFHISSIHQRIEPAIFFYQPENWMMYVKTTGAETSQAIAATEKQWKQYNPDYPFEYRFLDDTYDQLYQSDQRTGHIFNYFAGIAILVSCLGLFGLATFAAEQRVKEIGIRKVLGASVTNIVQLFAFHFMKLVFLAILIASPIAWYLMGHWLDNFAYRTALDGTVFLIAGLLALAIALFTVSYQSLRASLANPTESLRNE